MAKISKRKAKLHLEACELLKQDELSSDDKDFVYEHWLPSYNHNTGWIASFFTPLGLARDITIYIPDEGRIVDICAGIGGLSRVMLDRTYDKSKLDVVCVERSQDFVDVGKKLVPEATWIQGDVFDKDLWDKLGKFDYAISNPPFGQIGQIKPDWLKYHGVADLMAVEVALQVSSASTFILPQGSLPFVFSGGHKIQDSRPFSKLQECYPNIEVSCSSLDTSLYEDEWLDASPKVEAVVIYNKS